MFSQWDVQLVWVYSFLMLLTRYFLIAGAAYWCIYFIFNKRLSVKKIQQRFVPNNKIINEIIASVFSFIIFAAFMTLIVYLQELGLTKIYTDFSQHSWWYAVLSFVALLFIHDTYFYWMHRLMHLPVLFKHIHLHHHKSVTPTPWTAFSFHPVEAILEFAFIIPVVFILPLHPVVLMIFAFAMTAMNVLGHIGYELFPKNFLQQPLGKLFNTTTHHDMHHHYNKYNYGLYFNFWDLIMRTNHKKYQETFEQTASKTISKQTTTMQQLQQH